MANIQGIKNGESGLSARNKINAAIAEANKVDSKQDAAVLGSAAFSDASDFVASGAVGSQSVTTSTGTQAVSEALDERQIAGSVDIRKFGFTGAGDESDILDAAITEAVSKSWPLNLGNGVLSTDGPHTFPDGLVVFCGDFTIRRLTSGYTGTSPILTISDNCSVYGKLAFDGNNPSEAGTFDSSYPLLSVIGDNVSVEYIKCINTPMYTEQTKQLRGCSVRGDNFHCDNFEGDFCGYASLQLVLTKNMKRFYVGKFVSTNHHYKGFQVNDTGVFAIDDIIFDTYLSKVESSFAHDASEGLLIDTDADNSVIQINNFNCNYAHIKGGNSNNLKIENVGNFNVSRLELEVDTRLGAGLPMRMRAKECNIGSLSFDKELVRIESKVSNIGNFITRHSSLDSTFNFLRYEDSVFEGEHTHTINSFVCNVDSGQTSLIGLQHSLGKPLFLSIDSIKSPGIIPLSNYGGANGDLAVINGGIFINSILGYSGQLALGADRHKWVQTSNRVFESYLGVPALGVYKVGDYVRNMNTAIIDPSGENYINKGWLCVSGGDESSFEFVEDRLSL